MRDIPATWRECVALVAHGWVSGADMEVMLFRTYLGMQMPPVAAYVRLQHLKAHHVVAIARVTRKYLCLLSTARIMCDLPKALNESH